MTKTYEMLSKQDKQSKFAHKYLFDELLALIDITFVIQHTSWKALRVQADSVML